VCPAAAIAVSMRAANSGVPAKPTRMGIIARVSQLLFLAKLRGQTGAFERRQILDEDSTQQMVHFVLDADREGALGGKLKRLAALVLRANGYLGGAGHFVVVPRNRETALLGFQFAFAGNDLRVDEHLEIVSRFGDIDDDDALVDVDLRRRQPDARRRVHRLSHVADELLDIRRDGRNGRRDLLEPRIGVFEYVELRHRSRLACQMQVSDAESSLSPYFSAV